MTKRTQPRRPSYPPVPFASDFNVPETVKVTLAARNGDLQTVKSELDIHKSLFTCDHLFMATTQAAQRGHTEIVRLLLEHGAGLTTVPICAAESGSIPLFELFLEYGWDVNHAECYRTVVLPYVYDRSARPKFYMK